MQAVLTKYWLAIHVALLLFASWASLFLSRASVFVFLLWMSLMAVEALVLLPTVRKSETLADARLRVGQTIVRDPFFYLGLSVVGIVVVQWLNSGCSLVYLPDGDVWQRKPPAIPWAPFSVEPGDALRYVSIFSASFLGGLILRHSVGKAGKRALLTVASIFSGILACYMVWQACLGRVPYAGLALNPGASAYGSFFGFWLLLGMGAYLETLARGQRVAKAFFVFGFIGNLAGMLFFSSAIELVLYLVVTLLFLVYWLAYVRTFATKAMQVLFFLVVLATVASVVVSVVFMFPGNPVITKLRSLAEFGQAWADMSGARGIRVSAAIKIWKEHLWVGVGANGFFHFVGTAVEGKAWGLIKNDPDFVYNDGLQALCEFGVLGASLLGAGVVTLLVPVCYRMRLVWMQGGGEKKGGTSFLLRLSPFVGAGLCATILCFFESWVSNPFRSPGLLTSWVFVMATLPSFLPVNGRAVA